RLVANNAKQSNWDPLWPKLNAFEEYSLLKNPKSFTLLVKKYSGGGVFQAGSSDTGMGKGILNAIGLGSLTGGEQLNAAGAQAHELARLLRDPKKVGVDT